MRISIALATYNGAKYLQEQLDSFVAQTKQPDELVVCDDGSTDGTVELLTQFQKNAPFLVRLYKNSCRLGYVQNFGKAIELSEGDIIFISDQDDLWLPEKIITVIKAFNGSSDTFVVVNDQEIVNSDLSPTGLTILGQIRSAGLADSHLITGACTAIKKSFVTLAIPIPENIPGGHDTWIHRLAATLDVTLVIPHVLQMYRRHENNTSASVLSRKKRITWYDIYKHEGKVDPCVGYRARLKLVSKSIDRISMQAGSLCPESGSSRIVTAIDKLKRERRAVIRRYLLLHKGWLGRKLCSFFLLAKGDYLFFAGYKSLFKDLLR